MAKENTSHQPLAATHTSLHVCKHVHTTCRYTKESGGGEEGGQASLVKLFCEDYHGFCSEMEHEAISQNQEC